MKNKVIISALLVSSITGYQYIYQSGYVKQQVNDLNKGNDVLNNQTDNIILKDGIVDEKLGDDIAKLTNTIKKLTVKIESNKSDQENRIIYIEDQLSYIVKDLEELRDEKSNHTADSNLSPIDESNYYQQVALEQTRTMDEALAEEVRDEAWASDMEDNILAITNIEAYDGSTFGAPTCKSTFCQFEAYHSNLDSRDAFENIRREMPNSYHIQHFEEPDGTLRSVMYLIKQGEEANSVVFKTLNNSDNS